MWAAPLLLAAAYAALCLQPALCMSTPRLLQLQAGQAATPLLPQQQTEYLPVVLWHGMGDSCCDPYSIGAVKRRIEEELPGVFVHSVATGEGEFEDVLSGYFGSVNKQVAHVCDQLLELPQLRGGYVAVGFSQGGQFLRAVVQRCQQRGPRAHTLVTMGAQHQGVMEIPGCFGPSFNSTPSGACSIVQGLLARGAYAPWVRDHVVQAQYFKDPAHMPWYLAHNTFLADINNDRAGARSAQYKANLASLQRLVLFGFENDVTVVPKESSQFGFYDGSQLLEMQETPLYKEDWLGLRALNDSGRLLMDTCPGFHMQFTLDWFSEHVLHKYLAVPADGAWAAAQQRQQLVQQQQAEQQQQHLQ